MARPRRLRAAPRDRASLTGGRPSQEPTGGVHPTPLRTAPRPDRADAAAVSQLDFRLSIPDRPGIVLLLAAAALAIIAVSLWSRYRVAVVVVAALGVSVLPAPDVRVPGGHHDGSDGWYGNTDRPCRARDCLVALPELHDGTPSSWNAFPGEWGTAECTAFKYFCVRSHGRTRPAAKCARDARCRYLRPDRSTPGSERELARG